MQFENNNNFKFRNNNKNKKYYLGKSFPRIYFTTREAECMRLFLHNKSNSGVATLLGIAVRSVEFYLSNMKCKVCCKTKNELVKKIRASDFCYMPIKRKNND